MATITRRRHRVESELRVQEFWGVQVAAYLFLGGVGGGAYLVGFVAAALGQPTLVLETGVLVALGSVSVGSAFLVADLGLGRRAWRVFAEVEHSWIARGAWLLAAFLVLTVAHGLALLTGTLPPGSTGFLALGGVTALVGAAVMVYTGLLLSAVEPITFWDFPRLPLVFAVSAASTGAMSLVLLVPPFGAVLSRTVPPGTVHWLSLVDLGLLVLLAASLAVLLAADRHPSQRLARQSWLRGSRSREFWGLVVGLELLVPFVVEGLEVSVGVPAGVLAGAMVLGLLGGFWLRKLVLDAGYFEPLRGRDLPPSSTRQALGMQDPSAAEGAVSEKTVEVELASPAWDLPEAARERSVAVDAEIRTLDGLLEAVRDSFDDEEARDTFRRKALPHGDVSHQLHVLVDDARLGLDESAGEGLRLEDGQRVTLLLLPHIAGG